MVSLAGTNGGIFRQQCNFRPMPRKIANKKRQRTTTKTAVPCVEGVKAHVTLVMYGTLTNLCSVDNRIRVTVTSPLRGIKMDRIEDFYGNARPTNT